MNKEDILQRFLKVYFNKYIIYHSSIKSKEDNYFFIVKDDQAKYLTVIGKPEVVKKFEEPVSEDKKIEEDGLFAKV